MSHKSFEVTIEFNNELSTIGQSEEDFASEFELDDLITVFYIITNELSNNNVSFGLKVEGRAYPALTAEFSIFLECLSGVVDFVNETDISKHTFDFYEQGINYLFRFEKINDQEYRLAFEDLNSSSEIVMVRGTLLDLNLVLYTFYSRFIFLVDKLCTAIRQNELYVEWKDNLDKKFGIH